jgi:tripartite-type tricarboxylate transporter receptor subunit TctC
MPAELTEKIYSDLTVALRDPAVVDYLKKTGASQVGSLPKDFEAFMRAEADKWAPVLKDANITPQ